MPFLQFLSGARDQAFDELLASGSMVIGSGPEAQIQCSDTGVSPAHCQVYLADGKWWLADMGAGSTVMQMRRLGASGTPGTVPLAPGTVFIVGGTYVKFWAERPPEGGGGGGGGDPAALEAAQGEAAQAKTELESSQSQLRTAQAELESTKAGGADAASALQNAQGDVEASKADLDACRGELETAKGETETARSELAAAQGEIATAKTEQEAAQASHETELQAAKEAAEQAASEAEATSAASRAEVESALAASRGALEGLQAEIEAGPTDSLAAAADSDLQAILETLGLDDGLRRRLETAIAAEADREALRRVEGPVVPLRGLRVPGLDLDLEGALRRVKARNEQVALVRELGLDGLDESEVSRLMELARS